MSRPSTPPPNDSLLTIDVGAEIRKLCGEQFSSPAERLVELVRLVLRFGARAVRVRVGLRWATIETIGGTIRHDLLEYLAALADDRLTSGQRHAALVSCESEHVSALMALLGAPAASVESSGPTGRLTLAFRGGRRPTIARSDECAPSVTIRVARSGARRDELTALRRACRFASVPIFVGGRQVSRGMRLDDTLLELTMRDGSLECCVGLPRRGELCQTSTLCHHIVVRESYAMSRRGFVHSAVVHDRGARSGDEVRAKRVKALLHVARQELYRRLREIYARLGPRDRDVARVLLFRRSERSGDPSVVEGLPLFTLLDGQRVDLAQLRTLAREGVLWAVEARTTSRRWLVPAAEIAVLDSRDRDFIAKQLSLTCMQPPSLSRDGLTAAVRRAVATTLRRLRDSGRRMGERIAGAHPLSPAQLDPGERALLLAVQQEIGSGRFRVPALAPEVSAAVVVHFAQRGTLPLRLRRRGNTLALMLPRSHPLVRRAVQALAAEPARLYPILVVLFGGHDGLGRRKAAYHELLIAGASG